LCPIWLFRLFHGFLSEFDEPCIVSSPQHINQMLSCLSSEWFICNLQNLKCSFVGLIVGPSEFPNDIRISSSELSYDSRETFWAWRISERALSTLVKTNNGLKCRARGGPKIRSLKIRSLKIHARFAMTHFYDIAVYLVLRTEVCCLYLQ
jgi:hypothetical protein